MKSLKIKTLLTERFKDEHKEVFAKMTNRVRVLHETPESVEVTHEWPDGSVRTKVTPGTKCVKLHGEWWTVHRCPGGFEWDRSYLGTPIEVES